MRSKADLGSDDGYMPILGDALIAEFYGEGDKRRGQHWGEKRAAGNPHKYPQKASHTPRIHTKIVASETSQSSHSWRDRLERFRKEMNASDSV